MSEINTEHFRALLTQKRDELTDAANASKDSRRPVELDQTSVGRLSRMDAMQVQAMAVAEDTRRQHTLQRVAAAFERLENDEYGYCVTCGEPIAHKRLELDPATPTCIKCAGSTA